MRKVRIIPRLDIKGPNLIKSVQFEGLRVLGSPNDFAKRYYDEGADELLYMDVVASLYGRNSLNDLISKAAKNVFIPITVGGGIRSVDDAIQIFKSGADKIAINTAAVKNPYLISDLVQRFGSQSIVVSIEAKKVKAGSWTVYTDYGREKSELDLFKWIKICVEKGAGEIIITSIDREGTGEGFETEILEKLGNLEIPVIFCGGMGKLNDIIEVLKLGNIDAISMADSIHYNKLKISQIRDFALSKNLNLRNFQHED